MSNSWQSRCLSEAGQNGFAEAPGSFVVPVAVFGRFAAAADTCIEKAASAASGYLSSSAEAGNLKGYPL